MGRQRQEAARFRNEVGRQGKDQDNENRPLTRQLKEGGLGE